MLQVPGAELEQSRKCQGSSNAQQLQDRAAGCQAQPCHGVPNLKGLGVDLGRPSGLSHPSRVPLDSQKMQPLPAALPHVLTVSSCPSQSSKEDSDLAFSSVLATSITQGSSGGDSTVLAVSPEQDQV